MLVVKAGNIIQIDTSINDLKDEAIYEIQLRIEEVADQPEI